MTRWREPTFSFSFSVSDSRSPPPSPTALGGVLFCTQPSTYFFILSIHCSVILEQKEEEKSTCEDARAISLSVSAVTDIFYTALLKILRENKYSGSDRMEGGARKRCRQTVFQFFFSSIFFSLINKSTRNSSHPSYRKKLILFFVRNLLEENDEIEKGVFFSPGKKTKNKTRIASRIGVNDRD